MISKTKYEASLAELDRIFEKAKLGKVLSAKPLEEGEFNAAYRVETEQGRYVLKIAPPKEATILTYERDMMHSEVFWYEQIRKHTTVRVPEIYFVDESCELIPSHYFIMEYLTGAPLWAMNFSAEERALADREKIRMAGEIHTIRSHKFGYIQCGLKDSWYDAVREMVSALLADCARFGKQSEYGERLLRAIDRHQELLKAVEGTMVNFDLWDSNIFCERTENGLQFSWIDPERSFYGDPIADWIVCGRGPEQPLSDMGEYFDYYESVSGIRLTGSRDEDIRYAVALGYLALIMETERYNRYVPGDEGWERNTVDSAQKFEQALKILE